MARIATTLLLGLNLEIILCYLCVIVCGICFAWIGPDLPTEHPVRRRLLLGGLLLAALIAWLFFPSTLPDLKDGSAEKPWRVLATAGICLGAMVEFLGALFAGPLRSKVASASALVFPAMVLYYVVSLSLLSFPNIIGNSTVP